MSQEVKGIQRGVLGCKTIVPFLSSESVGIKKRRGNGTCKGCVANELQKEPCCHPPQELDLRGIFTLLITTLFVTRVISICVLMAFVISQYLELDLDSNCFSLLIFAYVLLLNLPLLRAFFSCQQIIQTRAICA